MKTDDKVVVWHNTHADGLYIFRYFYKFDENGKCMTYCNGQTSWTDENNWEPRRRETWDNYMTYEEYLKQSEEINANKYN